MKTQAVSNKPYFSGSSNVSGLNRKQTRVYEVIKDIIDAKIADEDYLVLNINGSSHPYILKSDYQKEPKYVIMHTQIKSATVPTAQSYTSSLNSKDWLAMVDKLIRKHKNSDLYKKTVQEQEHKLMTKLKKFLFIKSL